MNTKLKNLLSIKPRLALALLLLTAILSGCGGQASASTMFLRKTEGSIAISDGKKDITPAENLGLYSGYEVNTQSASYAWIDLDSVKLTKMDQDSEIAIHKDGKKLTIDVLSGAMFFNVTQPLEDDETMEIRTSTMLTGIRGTCGWIEVSENGSVMEVYLLEGKVECSARENTATVNAGEMAVMSEDGSIAVSEFTADDVPDFVMEEIKDDENLSKMIPENDLADVETTDTETTEAETMDTETTEIETTDAETTEAETAETEVPLPTDGDRIVLRGTIDSYSMAELIALQEIPENEASMLMEMMGDMRYRVIVLDTPQTLTLRNGDGDGSSAGEVRLISVDYIEELAQYEGRHLTFSIDPNDTWWPTDVSLPLGEPRISNVHVLGTD